MIQVILKCYCCLVGKSCLSLATPWTAARQAPLSMGFSRQEYWSSLPFPSSGDLPDPGIEPRSPVLQVDSLPAEPQGKPRKPIHLVKNSNGLEVYESSVVTSLPPFPPVNFFL